MLDTVNFEGHLVPTHVAKEGVNDELTVSLGEVVVFLL